MKKLKPLGLGIDDFKKIIEENYYYFDKTEMIEELLADGVEVTLFIRPRRFGKTLNMSMLKYFFNIEERENNRKLFDNLYISRSDFMNRQGENPVIFISFKNIKYGSWDECYSEIKNLIKELYLKFYYIREKISIFSRKEFDNILNEKSESSWTNSLRLLSGYLTEYYGKKAIILIDEYDTPIIYAYENNYYEKSVSFFKIFYGSALKGNEYLDRAVMTGILRIVKEGIFSDLNNLIVYTVLDKKYSSYFGLTEEEIIQGLEEYGLINSLKDVRKWYNGYKFGKIDVYNPWSIINYLNNKELRAYWVNTSNDNTINRLIKNANLSMFEDLKKIFEGKSINKVVNVFSNMSKMSSPQEIWHLMLFSGYLTVEDKLEMNQFSLRIPNYEVQTFFKDSFVEYNFDDNSNFIAMIDALINKDMETYEYYLKQIMLLYLSYYGSSKINEKPYHNLILGSILYLDGRYIINSNIERGFGRTDLTLTPKDRSKAGYIFEFKVVDSQEDMQKGLDRALDQIKSKKYDENMKNEGINEIIHIGMVFCGKFVDMKWETVQN